MTLAWGSVAGSALQFGIQLPVVLRLARHLRLRLDFDSEHVRDVLRNFAPVFISRGVVQISAYIDALLASLLPTGAVTGLINAQLIYVLPVSLFGMSVSAAELPVMSSATGSAEEIQTALRERIDSGLRHIAFFIVPSAAAFLAFGDLIAGALLQTGRFTHGDAQYVWGILAGSSVGLLASTMGRLYSSAYYALRDTRTPLKFAVLRVALTTVLGYICAKPLPLWIGIDPRWGVAGLTASAGIAGWVEFALLRRGLHREVGRRRVDFRIRREALACGGAGGGGWQRGKIVAVCRASHIRRARDAGAVQCRLSADWRDHCTRGAAVSNAVTSSLRSRSRCLLRGCRRFRKFACASMC